MDYWGKLYLFDADEKHSHQYTESRLATGVLQSTARRELESIRAAANHYCKTRKLSFRPVIDLPPKGEPRLRWLTRSEAARFIHKARRRGNHHVARIILIGIYTGARSGAIKAMKWLPSTDTGYFDLELGVMYRKGASQRSTRKRRPSVQIPERLLPHLYRWRKMDKGLPDVIHSDGEPVGSIRRAWAASRKDAELDQDVVPHVLRHTAASWGIQNVRTIQEMQSLADFLGMSLKMLLETYGHLNPIHQKAASDAISRRPGHI